MRVLDLFSGFGGWSQAFVNHGYEVLRIENNPLLKDVPYTLPMCIREFRDTIRAQVESGITFIKPDVILASPPCYEFSLAYNSIRSKAQRNNEKFSPDMELVLITIELIALLNPKYFIVENVNGSQKYFEPYFGKARQKIGAYVLYGKFPEIILQGKIPSKETHDKRHSILRSNHRAKIPLQLSAGALIAMLEQTYITDY